MINLCGSYAGSKQIFRSYSTSNLDPKNYGVPIPITCVSAAHSFERRQPDLHGELDVKSHGPNEVSSHPSFSAPDSVLQQRIRSRTISGHEIKSERTIESLSASKSTKEQQELKRYAFRKLFEKKKPALVPTHNCSEPEISGSQSNVNKKIKSKPLLFRSISSSCLLLAAKSRPKLISRSSCPNKLIPSEHSSKLANQNNSISWHGKKPADKKPTGENDAACTKIPSVTARLKDRLKFRRSEEITKRDSWILVNRFELELAITKDDRKKLVSFINSKSMDLNAIDYYGKTLLHTACSVGNYHCANILINAGARVDIQDQAGFTPLHCAVVGNHVPCAAVLIAAGADLMSSTRTMHTALTLAHEEEMILLIGRSLLLRGTQRKKTKTDDYKGLSLRETMLWINFILDYNCGHAPLKWLH